MIKSINKYTILVIKNIIITPQCSVFSDLQLAFDKFSQDGVTAYSQILFDVARHQVFVGAR